MSPAPDGPAWKLAAADETRVAQFAAELALRPPVARVLAQRVATLEEARRFLEPRLADLQPPHGLAGLEAAVARIGRAVGEDELVGVFGDYDADGVTSAALVAGYLERCGARVRTRVARRAEGYGFRVGQAEELVALGCRVLLITDCGTSDREAVAAAMGQGVDVVALDHHRVHEAGPWPGLALVNPHLAGSTFPDRGLCSAGLAFYFVAALRRALQQAGGSAPDPREELDLVALGTVADVAPLVGNNRILVARGLEQIARSQRPGLRELTRISDLAGRVPTAEDVAWRLAPRLNAPGRLGDAGVALACLWQRDEAEAVQSARRCQALNEERKAIQERMLEEANRLADARATDSFCLVAQDEWHPGVSGIVAGKLAESRRRPAAVVAWEGEQGRGSARGVPGLDLFALLERCGEHLVRFGGHAGAAGFTVTRQAIAPLRDALCEETSATLAGLPAPRLAVDAELRLEEADHELCAQLGRLAPHGEGNRPPIFAAADVRVESARTVGANHALLTLRQDGVERQAIGFGMADRCPPVGEHCDVAFIPEIDDYHGPRLRLRLFDVQPVGGGTGAPGGAGEEGGT